MIDKELTFENIVDRLDGIGQFVEGTGVERGRHLLNSLGNPERKLRVIHIAGTNGKGSTCAYISKIIEKNGHRVGLFTSPHLVDIRERIQINGEMISESDFCCYYEMVEEKRETKLAYFDYLFGMAMLYFEEKQVDFVVLETGLGGALDATNSVDEPIATVLTTISLEHTALLGDTVEAIAFEKAGIMKAGVPAVFSGMNEAVRAVFEGRAKSLGCDYVCVDENTFELAQKGFGYIDFLIHNEYYKNDCFKLSTNALYQMENASLALTVCGLLHRAGVLKLDMERVHEALLVTKWAGRMELIEGQFIVDGAHNPQGIEEFVRSVCSMYEDGDLEKATLLFSVVSDKNYEQMVATLCTCPWFDRICVTVTGGARHLDTEYIRKAFEDNLVNESVPIEVFGSVDEVIESVGDGLLFATGSLYLVSDVKKALANR